MIHFADFTLDTKNEELTRNGAVVSLQPQAMKVLLLLASRAGEVVTRQELQQAVWDKDTFVDFDQGLNWCIRRIREVLGDDASQPRFIQTLPRKGYRFLTAAIRTPHHHNHRRWLALAAVAVLCFGATGMLRNSSVTLVILPFDNFTGDRSNDVLADRTTEEVINRVGGIDAERIKVIDRLTAAKFKRTNECIIHIGEQLGAQFVMEGAVAPGRTTAALYRVTDNTQVWAMAAQTPQQISGRVAQTFISSRFN